MKRLSVFITAIFIVAIVFLGFFGFALAENEPTLPNPLTADTFQELLDRLLTVLLIFSSPIFILLIAWAGFNYTVGGSSPERRKTAKNVLKYGLMGYAIILGARVLVSILKSVFQ